MKSGRSRAATGLLLLGCLLYLPVAWNAALPFAPHSDVIFAAQSVRGFSAGLSEGVAYPRWIGEANRGHGAPTFLYYSPAAYYVTGLAHLITQSTVPAIRLACVVLALLSGLSFYRAMRRWSSNDTANAIGAALYIAMPYHVLDLYERLAIAEFAAFVLYPVVFATADRLIEGPSRRAWIGLALAYGALVFTHLVSAFMLAFVLTPYLVIRATTLRRPARLAIAAAAVAMGLLCSSAFLLPVLFERGAVHIEHLDQMHRFDWRRSMLFVDEVAAGYPEATVKPITEWSTVSQAILAIGSLAVLLARRRRLGPTAATGGVILGWGVLAIWAVVLQTPLSAPLWSATPGLPTVQFPWRFAGFQALAACVLAALAIASPAPLRRRAGSWICIAASAPALGVATFIATQADFRFDTDMAGRETVRSRPAYAYMPRLVERHKAIRDEAADLRPRAQLLAPGRVTFEVWTPHERRLRYEAATHTSLVLRTFDFPGWRATLDGRPVPVTATGRWRSLTLDAPAGEHEVSFQFVTTPLRGAASAITVLSLLALAWAAASRGGRRGARAGNVALLAVLALASGTHCSEPSRPAAKNLVVLTLDTVRQDHLSVHAYERPTTPSLEAFAERSVVFSNAFTQETNTNPSHASMFTGQYPHEHGNRVNGDILEGSVPTLAEILRHAGFSTGGFVSSSVLSQDGSGLARGFDAYNDNFAGARRTGVQTVRRALAWLRGRAPDERFFLFVHLYDAHGPYRPPSRHATRFRAAQPHGQLPLVPRHMMSFDDQGKHFRHLSQFVDQYDGTLRHTDDLFRMLSGALDMNETAVFVLADHGETLGERHHGLDHGGQVFDEQIRIPFLLHAPGLPAGRVEALVETVDLLPTALDVVGVTAKPPLSLPGTSLLALAQDGAKNNATEDFIFSSARAVEARHADRGYALDPNRRIQAIRSHDWKLIRYPRLPGEDGPTEDYFELYDLRSDPDERQDVAGVYPERLRDYRVRLEAWDPERGARHTPSTPLDPQLEGQLRELGYIEEAGPGPR